MRVDAHIKEHRTAEKLVMLLWRAVSEQREDDSTVLMLTAVPPSPRPIIVPSLCGGSAASTPRHAVSIRAWQEQSEQGAARPLADITNRAPDTGKPSQA